jgi:hypothetical protein
MKKLADATAPDAKSVLGYFGARLARARWLVFIAGVLVFGIGLVVFWPSGAPVWTGRTIVQIGLAPSPEYLIQETGPPLLPIESARSLVQRLSDPIFLIKVIARTQFEPKSADLSRDMAKKTLRGVALDGDRKVSVEVSAASRVDLEAVLQSLAAELNENHGSIANRRIETLRVNISDMQKRIDFIEKSLAELLPSTTTMPLLDQGKSPAGAPMSSNFGTTAELWNGLKDRARRNKALLALTENTVAYAEPDTYPKSVRRIAPGMTALLAGLAMLIAMFVLVVVTSPSQPGSDRSDNP